MKKAILMLTLLLATMSSGAIAEWTRVSSNGKSDFYVDLQTVRKKGDKVKMWFLVDFKSIQETNFATYLSQVDQSEFDCAEEQFRMIVHTYYDSHMGNGNNVFTYESKDKGTPIPPSTPLKDLWEVACSGGKLK